MVEEISVGWIKTAAVWTYFEYIWTMFGKTARRLERVIDYDRRDKKSHVHRHKMKKIGDFFRVNIG